MNIVEALQRKNNILRLEYEDKWLYWNERGFWRVRHAIDNIHSVIIAETINEELAIDALFNF